MKGSTAALIVLVIIGAMALYWFGIRKKSLSDLTAMFREPPPPVEPPPGVTNTPPPPRDQGSRGITTPPNMTPPPTGGPSTRDYIELGITGACAGGATYLSGTSATVPAIGLCGAAAPLIVDYAGDNPITTAGIIVSAPAVASYEGAKWLGKKLNPFSW